MFIVAISGYNYRFNGFLRHIFCLKVNLLWVQMAASTVDVQQLADSMNSITFNSGELAVSDQPQQMTVPATHMGWPQGPCDPLSGLFNNHGGFRCPAGGAVAPAGSTVGDQLSQPLATWHYVQNKERGFSAEQVSSEQYGYPCLQDMVVSDDVLP